MKKLIDYIGNSINDWINQSLYVEIHQPATVPDRQWEAIKARVDELKEEMGSTHLLHKSNQVQRKDGRKFQRAKLKRVV